MRQKVETEKTRNWLIFFACWFSFVSHDFVVMWSVIDRSHPEVWCDITASHMTWPRDLTRWQGLSHQKQRGTLPDNDNKFEHKKCVRCIKWLLYVCIPCSCVAEYVCSLLPECSICVVSRRQNPDVTPAPLTPVSSKCSAIGCLVCLPCGTPALLFYT